MDNQHEAEQRARGCKRLHPPGVLECGPHPRVPLCRTGAYFLDSSRSTGLATWLLYSANSLGEQSSSGMSKSSGSLCRISLLVACTGSVYITGSVNFIENSIASAEMRWNVSSTFNCSLCGQPAWSSHVLASMPVVSIMNV